MRTSSSSPLLLLAASAISLAHAQNFTNTTTSESCGGDINWINSGRSSANSTGQVEFKWTNSSGSKPPSSDSWYVSVTVNDTLRGGNDALASNGGIELRGYVSVPNDVRNASLCLWQFSSANVTLDGSVDDGLDFCGGVVSDECKDFVKDNLLHEVSGSGCPRYQKPGKDGAEAFKKACPNLGSSVAVYLNDISNTTCATTAIPNVNLPKGYHTYRSGSTSSPFVDYHYQSNMTQTYDLLVRQTVPYLMQASFEDPNSRSVAILTRFVCVTPNKTVEGSRAVLGGKAPWESKGVVTVAGRMAVAVAGVLAVMHII